MSNYFYITVCHCDVNFVFKKVNVLSLVSSSKGWFLLLKTIPRTEKYRKYIVWKVLVLVVETFSDSVLRRFLLIESGPGSSGSMSNCCNQESILLSMFCVRHIVVFQVSSLMCYYNFFSYFFCFILAVCSSFRGQIARHCHYVCLPRHSSFDIAITWLFSWVVVICFYDSNDNC